MLQSMFLFFVERNASDAIRPPWDFQMASTRQCLPNAAQQETLIILFNSSLGPEEWLRRAVLSMKCAERHAVAAQLAQGGPDSRLVPMAAINSKECFIC